MDNLEGIWAAEVVRALLRNKPSNQVVLVVPGEWPRCIYYYGSREEVFRVKAELRRT